MRRKKAVESEVVLSINYNGSVKAENMHGALTLGDLEEFLDTALYAGASPDARVAGTLDPHRGCLVVTVPAGAID